MESTESTTRERATTGKDGTEEADQKVLMSPKPLHRFVQKEPRTLGIVILMFGCAEVLMGFQLAGETETSLEIYIPFWQGALFLVCGALSIYTELHPSKKLVTVCLSMYVVSIFGIIVSIGFRLHCLLGTRRSWVRWSYRTDKWVQYRAAQILGLEGLLLTCSVCVSVLLIFLCAVARLALRSTHTQVILHRIPPPQSDTPSN